MSRRLVRPLGRAYDSVSGLLKRLCGTDYRLLQISASAPATNEGGGRFDRIDFEPIGGRGKIENGLQGEMKYASVILAGREVRERSEE